MTKFWRVFICFILVSFIVFGNKDVMAFDSDKNSDDFPTAELILEDEKVCIKINDPKFMVLQIHTEAVARFENKEMRWNLTGTSLMMRFKLDYPNYTFKGGTKITMSFYKRGVLLSNPIIVYYPAEKSELKELVDNYENVKQSFKYINASEDKKLSYDNAVLNGIEILNKESSTQESVNIAILNIKESFSSLDGKEIPEIEKNQLELLIKEKEEVKKSENYIYSSEDAKFNYDKAIEKGENILRDIEACQKDIDGCIEEILQCKENLKKEIELPEEPIEEPEFPEEDPIDEPETPEEDTNDEIIEQPPKPIEKPDYILYGPKALDLIFSVDASSEELRNEKEATENFDSRKFIKGYPDNTFRPEGKITRAETAAMIARLLDISETKNLGKDFVDLKDDWYSEEINLIINAGIMKGYSDGTFRPDLPITRGEFVKVISAFDKTNNEISPFLDIKGHWAEKAINQAYGNNRIKGYPDGEFKADNPITRAEAVTVLNKVFNIEDNLENENTIFKDLSPDHWAYYEIIKAVN